MDDDKMIERIRELHEQLAEQDLTEYHDLATVTLMFQVKDVKVILAALQIAGGL